MGDSENLMLQPGQQIKPDVTPEDVHRLVQQFYNLEVTSVKELNSYDDRNFFIKVKDDSVLPDPNDKCPHGYLLKILNSLDSKSGALIEAQNQMMLFLNQHGILCSKPVKNVEQKLMALAKIKGKFCFLFFFRNMLQFIDQSVFQMVEIKTLFVS